MPLYVYEVIEDDGEPGERFELIQRITDPPLTKHPGTGKPVRRVIQPVYVGGRWFDSTMKRSISDDKKLDKLGFTKYVKAGDGIYEKRSGKGPRLISPDRPIKPGEI